MLPKKKKKKRKNAAARWCFKVCSPHSKVVLVLPHVLNRFSVLNFLSTLHLGSWFDDKLIKFSY
jgi:hypothetical protein